MARPKFHPGSGRGEGLAVMGEEEGEALEGFK